MTESNNDVYRELQETLHKLPISFPATESGVEIKILKQLFKSEQALIASKLSFKLIRLQEIYESLDKGLFTIENLEEILDDMYSSGLILRVIRNGIKLYAASTFIPGFYEFQMNKMTKEFIYNVDQYFEEAYIEELNKIRIPTLRTIPIEQEIGIERNIATYDDFRYFLENCGEPIVLNECICRKKNDLTDRSCRKTDMRESCFSFRKTGKAYLARGLGKIISKEEALNIIEQAEREGLVIQTGNSQRPLSLCLCCGCCCNLLVNQKKFDSPAQYFASNYFGRVDEDLCTGCGVCANRCQMDAIEIIDEISNINLDRCIGCGVCVPTCPEEAIRLLEKQEKDRTIPEKNTMETYLRMAEKKAELSKNQ